MAPDSLVLPDWPRALGSPACAGRARAKPEDFRVTEIPLVQPSGEGSHLWLEIEKTNANTDWVARALSKAAGVSARDVGFAGMKDRRGVTRQWFSVALQEAENPDWDRWRIPDLTILQARRHTRKLRRGTLRGNHFVLRLRDLEGDVGDLEERLRRAARRGLPNYFGPQRFGFAGANVTRGLQWLERGGRLPRNRKSIFLSAVRSFLFNEVLAQRVKLGNWNRILEGEMAALDGSRSTFLCEQPDPELVGRCDEFDIHPSGPLPGRGGRQPRGRAAELEAGVLHPYREIVDFLGRAGVDAGRRSLRLMPRHINWELRNAELRLEFELPPGSYATSVLRELVSANAATISDNHEHVPS
jgi:tRNA pseudouridine13 synthase